GPRETRSPAPTPVPTPPHVVEPVAQPLAPVTVPTPSPVAQPLAAGGSVAMASQDAGVAQVLQPLPAATEGAPSHRGHPHEHARRGHGLLPEPALEGPPLTAAEVMPALRPLLPALQNCARGTGGNVDAYLSIDGHGSVRGVRLDGPFAHVPAAACVTRVLRVAR